MKIWLLLALCAPIFGANLLTYNIYERSDKIDVMLSFDAPYEGPIKQQNESPVTTLILSDLIIKERVEKDINSTIAQKIVIKTFGQNATKVELKSKSPMSITASKTADRFGLRIRISTLNISQNNSSIKTKDAPELGSRYFAVIAVLSALLIFLFFIKRRRKLKPTYTNQPQTEPSRPNFQIPNSIQIDKFSQISLNGDGVSILYQRQLDNINKIILIGYENRKYLVLVGTSNVLLDSFGGENIKSEQDFDVFLDQNKEKLDKIAESPLDSYKNALEKD